MLVPGSNKLAGASVILTASIGALQADTSRKPGILFYICRLCQADIAKFQNKLCDSMIPEDNIVFEPKLPSWKTNALKRLGMGNVAKVLFGSTSAHGRLKPENIKFVALSRPLKC